jgi:iron complex outermembrane receptor protein
MQTRAPISCLAVLCGLVCTTSQARAQATTEELKRMSLEELLDIQVTTVSRRPEVTGNVPAAVYVITQEDIRRSGATSIPEALRLAPGIQVARIDAGKWAIGMRGFADRLARSMLVLMDGRAVYSPLFAGTYWEVQDTLLDDIDRIEIIRGPGGTLWGANAVNGVINIITKPAAETQGALIKAEIGTVDHAAAAFQYGGMAADDKLRYRIYGKGRNRGHEFHPDGLDYDSLGMAQAGFRGDWTLSDQRTLTLQGDAYKERLGELATETSYTAPFKETTAVDAPLSGANVLARLAGPVGEKASFQLQAYYDRTNRDEVPVGERRDTLDVDFQQTHRGWQSHNVTWGLGYRVTSGRITAVPPSALVPPDRTDNLFSGFLQDEITLVRDRLRASIGTKLEHNDYSGFEIQPSARLLWTPDLRNTFVWSITRAVRTPSRVETDYTTTSLVSPTGPTFVRLLPDKDFASEKLIAYELGSARRHAQHGDHDAVRGACSRTAARDHPGRVR